MSEPFNTTLEISTRLLLVLYATPSVERSLEELAAMDYLACYAESFGIGDTNLHGDGEFNFGEMADRLIASERACAFMVTRGLAQAHMRVDGFTYSITNAGRQLCNQLNSEYASDYQAAIHNVLGFNAKNPGIDLAQFVNNQGARGEGKTLQ